jgi:Domain of unknown function (DUF4124)
MRYAAVAALIMSLPFAAAVADVYRSVDAQGQVHYSDSPTPGAELIHVRNLGLPATNVATSAPVSNGAAGNPRAAAGASTPPADPAKQQAAQQAVQKDVAQTRADQCKQATTDYNQSVDARRIYKTGANGEREYLSDADADQQRLNLRLAMESLCGSGQ